MDLFIEHNYYGKGLGKFFRDWVECFKQSSIKKRTLICNIRAVYDERTKREYFIRQEFWTDIPKDQLHKMGYKVCEGLHDNLAWSGVPIMVKLFGFKMIEITDPNFSKDTPTTLNDRMNNNLLTKFARSLARANAIAGMDLQKILLMVGVGIAAIIGMKYMGVF